MRDHEALGAVVGDEIAQLLPVFVGHFQAIFVQQRLDLVVKIYEAFVQDVLDLGLPDFELAEVVEVDLVDRAAGRDKANKHGGNAIIRL